MLTELLPQSNAEPWAELSAATAKPAVLDGALASGRRLSAAQAEAAAARLAPRLFIQAPATDVVGAFPTPEFGWLRAAGLLTVALPTELGGAGLHAPAATLPLLRVLQHIGRGNLAVGRIYEGT
jgi:alkylation response protein AidB-like acyl-CoA dehydrogenase